MKESSGAAMWDQNGLGVTAHYEQWKKRDSDWYK